MESEAAPGSFDVVLQSFSLHHLTAEGKQEFLRLVHRALRPGGAMVWIDVYSLVRLAATNSDWQLRCRTAGAALSRCTNPRPYPLQALPATEPRRRRVCARCDGRLAPGDKGRRQSCQPCRGRVHAHCQGHADLWEPPRPQFGVGGGWRHAATSMPSPRPCCAWKTSQ